MCTAFYCMLINAEYGIGQSINWSGYPTHVLNTDIHYWLQDPCLTLRELVQEDLDYRGVGW